MYTTSKEMIQKARAGGYAVPAFNAENLEIVQAIVAAACDDSDYTYHSKIPYSASGSGDGTC